MSQEALLITLGLIVVVMVALQGTVAYLILVERKVAALMQDRVGPNRCGPFGLLQPIADGLKFLLKEEVIPGRVDRFLYLLAPAIAVITTLLAFAVIPFGPTSTDPEQFQFLIAPNIEIGLLYIFALGSLGVYAVVLGGWASNNKYSFLGALRASAQVISYEIPLGLSILAIVLASSSLNVEHIIQRQADLGLLGWNLWVQPLTAILFFTAALAEANRLPFDLSECEQELVGGFHTEYSGLKFGMFFLGEYTHMIVTSFLTTALFLGGWHFPWIAEPGSAYTGAWAVKVLVVLSKAGACILLMMFLRWTIPRFRFDQLMSLAWKVFIPLGMLNLFFVAVVKEFALHPLVLPATSAILLLAAAVAQVPQSRVRRSAPPPGVQIIRV